MRRPVLQIRSRELGFLGLRRAVHSAVCGVVFVGVACSAGDPPALQDVGVDEKGPSSNESSESSEQAGNPDDFLGEETIEVPADCGDGLLAGESEFCDDGNNDDGDGCSEACQVEVGWICPNAGEDCEFSNYCGDSRLTPPEQCDDSNVAAGDGCDFNCRVEADWVCPMPGMPCQFAAVCGDGTRSALEQCDDGNTEPGDGCSEACAAELGFVCGDSIVAGIEDCDDGNASARDGCSPDCLLEPPRWDPDTNSMIGFVCDKPGEACRASVCGDGVLEGGEPCDDGNNGDMGDGCSPGCRLEPDCSAEDGSCVSNCGDGLILPGDSEECDDGNNEPGDGCDASCRIEAGFECPVVSEEGAVDLPIVYRDFKGIGWEGGVYYADGHPDFENEQFSRNTPKTTAASSSGMTFMDIAGPTLGLVDATLGAGQSGSAALKPVFASSGTPAQITSAATFAQWYTDVPGINLTIPSNLQLTMTGPNVFQFDTAAFYPLDDQGLVAAGVESARPTDWLGQGCGSRQPDGQWQNLTGGSHNFSFTSEVRYWFEYEGGEQLVFRGDDDVWVFIKRQLVVDLGGNHEPYGGDVCGNAWSVIGATPMCDGLSDETIDVAGNPLNLQVGRVYEVVVFQAERHTCQSNYRLTISNFARRRSECAPICGDGIIVGSELCDDGVNDGSYGGCAADCSRGPRCGDGVPDPVEQCDNGVNLDQYYLCDATGHDALGNPCTPSCGPNCTTPGYCGDGVVQAAFAEECDLGVEDNVGAYNGCNMNCSRGPHCGDGTLSEADGEKCDDGNYRSNDECSPQCEPIRPIGAR